MLGRLPPIARDSIKINMSRKPSACGAHPAAGAHAEDKGLIEESNLKTGIAFATRAG